MNENPSMPTEVTQEDKNHFEHLEVEEEEEIPPPQELNQETANQPHPTMAKQTTTRSGRIVKPPKNIGTSLHLKL